MNIVRMMLEEDLLAVNVIEQENFTDYWPERAFEIALEIEEGYVIMHPDNFRVIGFLFGYQTLDEFSISNIAIAKQWQNKGYASILMDFIIKRKKMQGVKNFFLEVRESNTPAQKLYEKFGFKTHYIRKNYYQNPPENALVMGLLTEGEPNETL